MCRKMYFKIYPNVQTKFWSFKIFGIDKFEIKVISVKCNRTKFTVFLKNFARERNACHHIESPIGNTIFHRVRFGLWKAFTIVFERSATTKDFSTKQTKKRLKISNTSATNFIKKVTISKVSSVPQPVIYQVFTD